MRKKWIPEALARAVMSLYIGVETKVKAGTHICGEFEVDIGEHQGSILSSLLFATVIDVATNETKDGSLQDTLHADDLVLTSENMAELHNKFYT